MLRVMMIAVLALAGGAAAAESPFVGTWKMNAGKSSFTGETVTYAKTATGYHFASGGAISYDFADDGRDYPMLADRTIAWTRNGDGSWDTVIKIGGKTVRKGHRRLSADGSTMTASFEDYQADGTTAHDKTVWKRVAGTSGLAGTWKSVKVEADADVLAIDMADAQTFRIQYPQEKMVILTKGDGSPMAATGPTVPPGMTDSYTAEGPMKMTYAYVLNGKPMGAGVMTVSSDGRTLTDTSWDTGKESEKSVEVYDKQ